MSTDADELLKAEQSIQELLKELQNLKSEIGSYDTAKKSLTETQTALGNLVAKISALAEKTQSVADSLKAIGTPEILTRLNRVHTITVIGLLIAAGTFVGIIVVIAKLF